MKAWLELGAPLLRRFIPMADKLAGSSVPPAVGLPAGLLQCLHQWWLAFPRTRDLRQQERNCCSLWPSLGSYPTSLPQYPLVTKVDSIQCGRGPHKNMSTGRRGSLRAILETGCHSHKDHNRSYCFLSNYYVQVLGQRLYIRDLI